MGGTDGSKQGHIHAKAMMQYAEDATKSKRPYNGWRFQSSTGNAWQSLNSHPLWQEYTVYKRNPVMIDIGSHTIEAAVTETPLRNTIYFCPSVSYHEYFVQSHWTGCNVDVERLNGGIIHLSKENAIAHAHALISLTDLRTK